MRQIPFLALFVALTAACAYFPELDNAVSEDVRQADYPNLIPIHELSPQGEFEATEPAEIGKHLLARTARLRTRADILRAAEQIDDESRLRVNDRLEHFGG